MIKVVYMNGNTFEEGEYVVYPAHGIGIVKGVEQQSIAGNELKMLVVSFDKDKMTIKLPLNSATSSRIRKLCSKKEIQEAIDCLKSPIRVKKMMWSRRAQEYETKINSGIPLSIAQVVRDLHRTATQPEHSYSERQIYQEALDRLMKEYAAVTKIGEKEAMEYLEKDLTAA
jgi:CarD family transcriptional regulator